MERTARAFRSDEATVTMSEVKNWYLVSYDVRDDKRLRRVARVIEGYGSRVQFSVFRCRLNKRGLERLKWELVKIMDKEDDLLVIGLCERCADRISRRNTEERWSDEITSFEIV
jgi:CRISPR-associated protein Cas2